MAGTMVTLRLAAARRSSGANLLVNDVRVATQRESGLALEAVELEVEGRPHFCQLRNELVVTRDTPPVRVNHHEADPARLGGLHEFDDLRVDRRLAAGKLDDFWRAFGPDEIVEHRLDFLERQAEAWAGRRKTQRAIHVAHAVDLDDPEARVLLMVGAEAAVVRASVLGLGAEGQRDRSRLVVLAVRHVRLGVPIDQRFKRPASGTPFPHVDLVVTEDHLTVDDAPAIRADASRQLVEDVVGVGLGHGSSRSGTTAGLGIVAV
jgi:hypothetical protein